MSSKYNPNDFDSLGVNSSTKVILDICNINQPFDYFNFKCDVFKILDPKVFNPIVWEDYKRFVDERLARETMRL